MQYPFDMHRFIADVTAQNAEALFGYFTPDAVICWHDSNEQLTVAEFIRANCEYPGNWQGEVQRMELIDGGVVWVTRISSDKSAHLVVAFAKVAEGKITRLDEYYSSYEEVPAWRKAMNIGRPII